MRCFVVAKAKPSQLAERPNYCELPVIILLCYVFICILWGGCFMFSWEIIWMNEKKNWCLGIILLWIDDVDDHIMRWDEMSWVCDDKVLKFSVLFTQNICLSTQFISDWIQNKFWCWDWDWADDKIISDKEKPHHAICHVSNVTLEKQTEMRWDEWPLFIIFIFSKTPFHEKAKMVLNLNPAKNCFATTNATSQARETLQS